MNELDGADLAILSLLQAEGRISNAELASRVGLAPATVLRRVKLLEERGYIRGYTALLDPLKLELHVMAFVMIETDYGCDTDDLTIMLRAVPEVIEAHRVIGEWCYMLKIRTSTPQALERLINSKIRKLGGIRRTMTILATSTPYETTGLPLPVADTAAPEHAIVTGETSHVA